MALTGPSAVRAGLARPSSWLLVAVNLGILLAVLYFGWSVFDVMFLFWAENVIIGIINVFIIALHITILLGGFLTMALGDQTWMLVILILLKTLVDLAMHGRERQKYIKEQWVTS